MKGLDNNSNYWFFQPNTVYFQMTAALQDLLLKQQNSRTASAIHDVMKAHSTVHLGFLYLHVLLTSKATSWEERERELLIYLGSI